MKAELERVWGRDCFACNSESQSHSSLRGIITSHVLCSLARWSCINFLQLLPSVQQDVEMLQVNSQEENMCANVMHLKTFTIIWNAFLNVHLWSNFAANQKDSSENRKRLPRIGRVLREAAGFLQRMLGLYMYITFSGTSTLIPTISVSTGTSVSNPTTGSCATCDVWLLKEEQFSYHCLFTLP